MCEAEDFLGGEDAEWDGLEGVVYVVGGKGKGRRTPCRIHRWRCGISLAGRRHCVEVARLEVYEILGPYEEGTDKMAQLSGNV